jgi:Flp pilus assembly protein TadD
VCLAAEGDAAVPACRRALELGLRAERAAVVNGVLASKLAASDRWDEAASALAEWCRLAPGDPEPRRRLADVLLHGLGRAADAVAELQEAVRLSPDDGPAWGALGIALAAARRYDEATVAFDKAIGLDATFFDIRPAARTVADAARQHKAWP